MGLARRLYRRMPIWLIGLIVVGAGYLFFALFAYVAADGILFQPRLTGYDTTLPGYVGVPAKDGVTIATVHLPNPPAKYTLLYFHGNAEDLGDLHDRLVDLQRRGFAVVGFDSRGYGLTPGEPREASLYTDMEDVYDYVVNTLGVPPNRIIAYGFSLGAGGAVELAKRKPVAGLVIQAGFVSAYRVVTGVPVLPWDRFRNLDKIAAVNCPVLVMHGSNDRTVPFSHGEKLFAAAKEPKRSFWVFDAGHNNFLDRAGERYWTTMAEFRDVVDQAQR